MKGAILVCFLALGVMAFARPNEQYTDKYDNFDLDEVMGNDKLLESYMNCCLNKGKCTPQGKELKSHIPDAMKTNCEKCTDAQRKGTEKMMKFLIKNKPAYWTALKSLYDPTGEYAPKYEEKIKADEQ